MNTNQFYGKKYIDQKNEEQNLAVSFKWNNKLRHSFFTFKWEIINNKKLCELERQW